MREAAAAWGEATANWNNQPALGARYGAVSYTPNGGVVRIDVTALATRWHTGVISNTGLVLLPADATSAIAFASRNSATGGPPPSPPKLIISCATPDEPVARDQTQADKRQTAGLALLKQRSAKPCDPAGAARRAQLRRVRSQASRRTSATTAWRGRSGSWIPTATRCA